MNNLLFINSILFILSSVGYLLFFKFLDYNYNLNNFWFNNVLTCILSPIYIFKLVINYKNRANFKSTFKNGSYKFILYAGCLYSIESILVYYCMISLSLFDYIIFRSSFIIWNIPIFKYIFNQKISKFYTLAVCLLIMSQLIILNFNNLEYYFLVV